MNLADIKARAKAATPGPWTSFPGYGVQGEAIMSVFRENDYVAECDAEKRGPVDAEFIANARTDIPKLVAALEAVQELARVRQNLGYSLVPEEVQHAITVALDG